MDRITKGGDIMLTLAEAKEILRIDTDFEDNRIQAIINILPHYIYERTGYPINRQESEPLCHLLETFLIVEFYLPDESNSARGYTIKSLIASLKYKAVEIENAETS